MLNEDINMLNAGQSVKYKKVVVTKSDGVLVLGWINIRVKNRISDFINDEKKFITLVLDINTENKKCTIINKDFIVQIEPLEE